MYYYSTFNYSFSLGIVTQVRLVFQRELYLLVSGKSLVDYNLQKKFICNDKNSWLTLSKKMKYGRSQSLWIHLEASCWGVHLMTEIE